MFFLFLILSIRRPRSAFVAIDSSVHKDGTATDSETSHRPGGVTVVERRLAGVLRRKIGKVYWKTGEEVSDMVHRWLLGRQDDVGRSFSSWNDLTGRGQTDQTCH